MDLTIDTIETDIGPILLACHGVSLCALDFADCRPRMDRLLAARFGDAKPCPAKNPNGYSDRVAAYFGGDLKALDGIPLETGGTPFQRKVWTALGKVEPGQTQTYGEVAAAIGRPAAARAVGRANGLNPIAIAIPCHRIIGGNGSLTGYAGGIERKRWLLEHEQKATSA